jgi:hypothetical protein
MSKLNLRHSGATNDLTSSIAAVMARRAPNLHRVLESALAMPLVRALLLLIALASPGFAQTPGDDGASGAAAATDAAAQLHAYLDGVLKDGGRPDYSKPPASDLLGQVFDLERLEALPPVQGSDLLWLLDWGTAANGAYKSIMAFGIAPPVNVQTDAAALTRNFTDYQDQEAAASNFMIRMTAREIRAAFMFMDQLAPAQRTPVRMDGLRKMRLANAETVVLYLGCIVPGMKPANARLISAAIRDTSPDWATAILPADRPTVLAALVKGEAAVKDDETRNNLASLGALLTEAK